MDALGVWNIPLISLFCLVYAGLIIWLNSDVD